MHLIQILLPLYDNAGSTFGEGLYGKVTRAPAQGLWKDAGKTRRDDIVVFEVMVEELDADWWRDYRRALESTFKQDEIVIRAQLVMLL